MIAKANEGGTFTREKTPTGLQQAVCTRVFDLGLQGGGKFGPKYQVMVFWELAAKMTEGDYAGQPFVVNKRYSLSLGSLDGTKPSNLRKDLESWRSKAYTEEELKAGVDLEKVLPGRNCQLNIVENARGYAEVANVLPPAAGAPKIKPVLPPDWMPNFVKALIEKQLPVPPDKPANPPAQVAGAPPAGNGNQKPPDEDIF